MTTSTVGCVASSTATVGLWVITVARRSGGSALESSRARERGLPVWFSLEDVPGYAA